MNTDVAWAAAYADQADANTAWAVEADIKSVHYNGTSARHVAWPTSFMFTVVDSLDHGKPVDVKEDMGNIIDRIMSEDGDATTTTVAFTAAAVAHGDAAAAFADASAAFAEATEAHTKAAEVARAAAAMP